MITPDALIAEARQWIETPYKHLGRTKNVGVDCVGLIVGVPEVLTGIRLYERLDYSDHPKAEKLLTEVGRAITEQEGRVQPGARPVLHPGEVVAVYVNANREPQHLALVAEFEGRPSLIHAFNKHNRVVEHGLTPWWHDRICRVYRYPFVEYPA